MKFTVERDGFYDALSSAMRRTRGGPDIPILSHVLIETGENAVTITGNDLDTCASATLPAEIGQNGAIAIPADRLQKLLGGLSKGGNIIVASDGENAASVKAGRAHYSFATLPVSYFPGHLNPTGDERSFSLTPAEVERMFKSPAPCISDEKTRFYLNGICLHPVENGIAACATDGSTLLKTVTPKKDVPEFGRVIVPEGAAEQICGLAKAASSVEIAISSNLIAAKTATQTFVSKLIDGTFPDYDRVIPSPGSITIKVSAKEIDAALTRLATASDPKSTVAAKIAWGASGELKASLHSQFGHGDEIIESDIESGSPGALGVQIELFRRVIAACEADVVEISVNDPSSPIRITNPKDDGIVGICMPYALK